MPCIVVDLPGGGTAICRVAGKRRKPCRFCATGFVDKLCDFGLYAGLPGKTVTCDRGMCSRCATSVGPDKDYCPDHKMMGGGK